MINEELIKILQYIDTYQERFINDLREAVEIRSVSGSYEHNADITKMIKWTESWLKKLKCTYSERFDIGSYSVDGKTIKLPTVILAAFGKDTKKSTLCVYCRIDVKNANAQQWQTDPWTVVQKSGHLYGRGTCKGKTPLLNWFHCIEAFINQKIPLPVNVKFIIEAMSEMNCFGLENFLYTQRLTFLRNIDYICVNESEWLNSKVPCISYAACGICHYELSANFNKTIAEKIGDSKDVINWIFNHFVDDLGNILIPKMNDCVLQINPEGEKALENVICDLTEIKKTLPDYMQNWSKQKILMRMWRFPALVGREVTEDTASSNDKEVATKRFFIKIVPSQYPDQCTGCLFEFIKQLVEKKMSEKGYTMTFRQNKTNTVLKCQINSGNNEEKAGTIECKNISATRPWHESSTSPHYMAARNAVLNIYKYSANMIRESVDIPIILILEKVINIFFLFL